MIQGHLLDTLNMVIGCVENFLEQSEKQKHPQKRGFLKNRPQKSGLKAALKNSIFEGVFACQITLKNFLRIQWPCSKYLEGATGSYLHAHTKVGTVQHINQKICTEKQKKNRFFETSTSKKRFESSSRQTLFLKVILLFRSLWKIFYASNVYVQGI